MGSSMTAAFSILRLSPDAKGPQHNEQAGGFLKAGVLCSKRKQSVATTHRSRSLVRRTCSGASAATSCRSGDDCQNRQARKAGRIAASYWRKRQSHRWHGKFHVKSAGHCFPSGAIGSVPEGVVWHCVAIRAAPPPASLNWNSAMDEPPTDFSYRSLELLCRRQAALASTEETRQALEMMAAEYQKLADQQERQRRDPE